MNAHPSLLVPLDIFAWQVHARIPAADLAALGHGPPVSLVLSTAPGDNPDELRAYTEQLNESAAAVADWLRSLRRFPVLEAAHGLAGARVGRGLIEPIVDAGPGLDDLALVVWHKTGRKVGATAPPEAPRSPGWSTNARPRACQTCGTRVWSQSPMGDLVGDRRTRWVEDDASIHQCEDA